MAINLVRKPSETPNINNYDDYRMFRYATGGENGVVENFRNECHYAVDGLNFTVKSGEIIIDGVQALIDANGVTIALDNVVGTEYYTVYCEVNLSLIDSQKVEIKSTKSTTDYPFIEKGDDLTDNQTGIARLVLYQFKINNGVIGIVHRVFNFIRYGNMKRINNLEIKRDDNSLLQIEESFGTNVIIPQKIILWAGEIFVSTTNPHPKTAPLLNYFNIDLYSSKIVVVGYLPKKQNQRFEFHFIASPRASLYSNLSSINSLYTDDGLYVLDASILDATIYLDKLHSATNPSTTIDDVVYTYVYAILDNHYSGGGNSGGGTLE